MILYSRELEESLGNGEKKIEKNEIETVVLQRRSIRIKKDIKKGQRLNKNNLICLRPCPRDAIEPYELNKVLGRKTRKNLSQHDYLRWKDIKK